MEFLCEYDFEVKYIQGKENVVANALSRRRHEISAMTLRIDLRSQILNALSLDGWYSKVKSEIESGRSLKGKFAGYSLDSDGVFHYSGHVYVPPTGGLRTLILTKTHRAPYSTHPGVKKMYSDQCSLYFWSGMKRDITDFVARCLECQRFKAEYHHLARLLQSNLVPEWKWDIISMDFIVGLPMSSR